MSYLKIARPSFGADIRMCQDGRLLVPDCPIIPFIESKNRSLPPQFCKPL